MRWRVLGRVRESVYVVQPGSKTVRHTESKKNRKRYRTRWREKWNCTVDGAMCAAGNPCSWIIDLRLSCSKIHLLVLREQSSQYGETTTPWDHCEVRENETDVCGLRQATFNQYNWSWHRRCKFIAGSPRSHAVSAKQRQSIRTSYSEASFVCIREVINLATTANLLLASVIH
jgi:hypothetical protein